MTNFHTIMLRVRISMAYAIFWVVFAVLLFCQFFVLPVQHVSPRVFCVSVLLVPQLCSFTFSVFSVPHSPLQCVSA